MNGMKNFIERVILVAQNQFEKKRKKKLYDRIRREMYINKIGFCEK